MCFVLYDQATLPENLKALVLFSQFCWMRKQTLALLLSVKLIRQLNELNWIHVIIITESRLEVFYEKATCMENKGGPHHDGGVVYELDNSNLARHLIITHHCTVVVSIYMHT